MAFFLASCVDSIGPYSSMTGGANSILTNRSPKLMTIQAWAPQLVLRFSGTVHNEFASLLISFHSSLVVTLLNAKAQMAQSRKESEFYF
jgi:hypothetical protein